ncbi:MAG: hypothetical protein KDC87_02940 [Planctomycetes bacterium]|nr:hypothetical protein [Planctomycetota bacterium]
MITKLQERESAVAEATERTQFASADALVDQIAREERKREEDAKRRAEEEVRARVRFQLD